MLLPPSTVQIEVTRHRDGLFLGQARFRPIAARAWNLWDLEAALLDEVCRYCSGLGNPPAVVEIWYEENLLARLNIAVLALMSTTPTQSEEVE